jgi:O-antigen/teichoic acid export membrane protein
MVFNMHNMVVANYLYKENSALFSIIFLFVSIGFIIFGSLGIKRYYLQYKNTENKSKELKRWIFFGIIISVTMAVLGIIFTISGISLI